MHRNVKRSHAVFLKRLPSNHQVHGREQPFLTTRNQSSSPHIQLPRSPLHPRWRQPNKFQPTQQRLHRPPAHPSQPQTTNQIPQPTSLCPLPGQRRIPSLGVSIPLRKILLKLHLKAHSPHRRNRRGPGNHIRDAIAALDAQTDGPVSGQRVVVRIRHHPLVDAHLAAGLEHAVHLRIDALERGCMASSLDSIHDVKRPLGEILQLHKVVFYKADLACQPGLCRMLSRALDLVGVVVHADDGAVCEGCDLAGGAADAAADVEDGAVRGQVEFVG